MHTECLNTEDGMFTCGLCNRCIILMNNYDFIFYRQSFYVCVVKVLIWCLFVRPHSKNHLLGTNSPIYSTNSTFIASIIVYSKLVQIVFTGFGYGHYKGLPSSIKFYALVIFSCLLVSFIFIAHFFRGLAGACVNPGSIFSNSFCAFTCLSNNSLIS